jgi:hypothetical protein
MDHSADSPRFASSRLKIRPWLEPALWLVLLIVPLAIGLAWGTFLDDSAYVTFHHARNLAAESGLAYDPAPGGQALLTSPLYVLALALLARLGVSLPQAGLILSALGWGAAVVAIYSIGKAMHQPVAAVVSAALVAFSPLVVSTLGTEISWTTALAGIAVALSVKRRWTAQACVLALMLGTHCDLNTLALATLLSVVQWIERRRFPVLPGLVLAAAVLGWALTVIPRQDPSPPLVIGHWSLVIDNWSLIIDHWARSIQRLADESEFYWLFLPCIGAGLLATKRKALWAGLLWGVVSTLSGSATARAMMAVLGLFLAGLGIDWAISWIETHKVVRLDRLTLAVSLALLAGLPLSIAQASSLLQRYPLRPVARQALEQQAGDWLRAHSEPTAMVLGSERVGYLADRSTFPWDGGESDQAALAALIETLNENPPAYCVAFRSIAWDRLTRTAWFQDRYEPLQEFESPYDATSPFTIWGHRFRALGPGEYQPVNVHLPGKVNWVGYRYQPDRIQPGGAVHVTLLLQATQPVTAPFRTLVRVISPHDGVAWAQQDMITPHEVPADAWQPGQVIAEQFVLTTSTDISAGAYQVNVSVATPDSSRLLPMYRRNDTAALDRITLGYVVVPWQGSLDTAKPVSADFGDQVSLLSFESPDSLSPGAEFDVVLYWEALHPPEDDYVVFVHLLTADGQLVASHDGPPLDGRYPTTAWLPGDVVPHVVHMALDPQTPGGTYHLQVGMYQWPSMERLPVWDSEGVEQTDRVIALQPIEVH